jgi:hypothetical protein
MNNESLNAENAGLDQAGAQRMLYHSPKFLSLGPIQSLVQGAGGVGPDGGLHDVSASPT